MTKTTTETTTMDIIDLIERFGSENIQNFQTTLSEKELKVLSEKIKQYSNSYKRNNNEEYIQSLCDIIFFKICVLADSENLNFQDVLDAVPDMFVLWDDIIKHRYLKLKRRH